MAPACPLLCVKQVNNNGGPFLLHVVFQFVWRVSYTSAACSIQSHGGNITRSSPIQSMPQGLTIYRHTTSRPLLSTVSILWQGVFEVWFVIASSLNFPLNILNSTWSKIRYNLIEYVFDYFHDSDRLFGLMIFISKWMKKKIGMKVTNV